MVIEGNSCSPSYNIPLENRTWRRGVDITDIISEVKGMSMTLPRNKMQKQEVIRRIAEYYIKKQGYFFLAQIFDILETAYPNDVRNNEEQIEFEIEEWVSINAEDGGEEGDDTYYRLR